MRTLEAGKITAAVSEALQRMNYHAGPELKRMLEDARERESSPLGRQALELLLKNMDMAAVGVHPLCQDTGLTVMFVDIGQDVHIAGGDLDGALQEGVRQATREGGLRNSVSVHPLQRENTGDNTPAVVHTRIVPGKGFTVRMMSKGGGSENASALTMLVPAAGVEGVEAFVEETVRRQGAMACPPLIVGVGLGGNFESAPALAKQALFRPLGRASEDPALAELESRLLARINRLGVGPQGWGGTVTALAVAVEARPCHIASLPVAVNVECHSHRTAEVKL